MLISFLAMAAILDGVWVCGFWGGNIQISIGIFSSKIILMHNVSAKLVTYVILFIKCNYLLFIF